MIPLANSVRNNSPCPLAPSLFRQRNVPDTIRHFRRTPFARMSLTPFATT